jgi:multiple sugar transport system permease protein
MTDISPDRSKPAATARAGTATPPRPSRAAADRRPPAGPAPRPKAKAPVVPWVLMSPALTVLVGMTVAPAVYLVYSSLRNEQLLTGGGGFIGLSNYQDILTDPTTRHSLWVTLAFVAAAVLIQTLLGLLLAVPLAEQTRANNVGATLLLLPFAITPAVSGLVFRQLLNPNYGWVDYYMGKLGLPAHVDWFANAGTAWVAVVGLDVWQWTPFVALILIAGLQSLPREPIEAAAVDGATRWQTFRYVTLPQLAPFIAIAVVLRTIQAFKTFDTFKILTGGGPGNSTEIINLGIYRIALQSFRVGAAAALGILFLIILSLLVPVLLRVVGRNTEEA